MRSLVVKNDAMVELKADNRLVRQIKKGHVQPSEMITLSVGPKELEGLGPDSVLELSIV